MIVSLPMYERAQTRAANDRLWALIRAQLDEGPAHLQRDDDLWAQWCAPDLLLSQTCGYPYRARLHDKVTLIGAPDNRLDGCEPGFYNSVFVARRTAALDAFDGARFAYNEAMSQSGWAAPMVHATAAGVRFGALVLTGAHRNSAQCVADGNADIAALDALSWRMMQRWDPFAANLHEVARTAPTPALPFISAPNADAPALRAALRGAIRALPPSDRDLLSLHDVVQIAPGAYLSVPTPPTPAQFLGS